MKWYDQSYTKKMQLRLCQDLGWVTSESYLCYDSWMTGNEHSSFVRYSVRYSLFTPPLLQLWRHLLETLNDIWMTANQHSSFERCSLFTAVSAVLATLYETLKIGSWHLHSFSSLDFMIAHSCESANPLRIANDTVTYIIVAICTSSCQSLAIAVIRLVGCTIFRLWFLPT